MPGCPAWNAADLLWHLTEVQHFWAWVITNRPANPQDGYAEPERPGTYEELVAGFDRISDGFIENLAAADPTEKAWSWSQEQSVGFSYRRQAHEALIHRLDAEQTAGAVTSFDPQLAADGVREVLGVMYGGAPPWGSFGTLPHYVRVDCTDTGDRAWVQLGHFAGTDPEDGVHYEEDAIALVDDPGVEADTVVEGPAGRLDSWLWRRSDDEGIVVHGDRRVYDHFRAAVHHPID